MRNVLNDAAGYVIIIEGMSKSNWKTSRLARYFSHHFIAVRRKAKPPVTSITEKKDGKSTLNSTSRLHPVLLNRVIM
ncbi:hypothetical protein C0J52_25125 [Blattella germanica]|nr:hypothetical protein C0J52_25125 [Blattella germanica]